MQNCPECEGFGVVKVLVMSGKKKKATIDAPCDICSGSGLLPEKYEYNKERGEKLKQARLNTYLSLKAYCHANNLIPEDRILQERGYFMGWRKEMPEKVHKRQW